MFVYIAFVAHYKLCDVKGYVYIPAMSTSSVFLKSHHCTFTELNYLNSRGFEKSIHRFEKL